MRISQIIPCLLVAGTIQAETIELEEVVVTATKRGDVNVQDVAASISVFGSDLLENANIESLTDLTQLSPSMIAVQAQNPSNTRIGLRGLSTPANNVGFEASVGVSIDGVARSRTGIALSELPELVSIEVLRGPQGTLFGRNTSAGVININTAKPDVNGGGYITVAGGNYDATSVQGAINFELSDQWLGRIDAKYRERDGFLDDVNNNTDLNDLERTAFRAQFTNEGTTSSWRILLDYATSESDCCGAIAFQQAPGTALANLIAGGSGNIGFASTDVDDLDIALSPGRPLSDDTTDLGFSIEYNREVGDNSLTSITAYRDWESDITRDGDLSGLDTVFTEVEIENSTFSQELRLQGERGALNWLVGAYYMHDEVDNRNVVNPGTDIQSFVDRQLVAVTGGLLPAPFQAYGTLPTPLQAGPQGIASLRVLTDPTNPALALSYVAPVPTTDSTQELETDAFALFTHNELQLSDQWSATLGLRLTRENRDIDYVNVSTDSGSPAEGCRTAAALAVANPALAAFGGLLCLPPLNILLDGTGSDDRSDSAASGTISLAYAPNEDTLFYGSYSRGFKSGGYNLDRSGLSLAGGALASDLEFDAEEVDALELGWNSRLAEGRVTFNGAIFQQEVDNLQQLNFTGTNFEVTTGDFEIDGIELDLIAQLGGNFTAQAGYAHIDAEETNTGEAPNAQPENTFNVAGTLSLPLGDSLLGIFHANARYNGEQRIGGTDEEDSYTLFNARVTITPQDGNWEIAIFGENLNDKVVGITSFGLPLQAGSRGVFPTTPRMYGAQFRYNF